jgi:hypothetical protein
LPSVAHLPKNAQSLSFAEKPGCSELPVHEACGPPGVSVSALATSLVVLPRSLLASCALVDVPAVLSDGVSVSEQLLANAATTHRIAAMVKRRT